MTSYTWSAGSSSRMIWLLREYDLTMPIRLDEPSISYSSLVSVPPLIGKPRQLPPGKPSDWLATDGRTKPMCFRQLQPPPATVCPLTQAARLADRPIPSRPRVGVRFVPKADIGEAARPPISA